jgi:hypothetical protein
MKNIIRHNNFYVNDSLLKTMHKIHYFIIGPLKTILIKNYIYIYFLFDLIIRNL